MKIILIIFILVSQSAFSLPLNEFYEMKDTERVWYLGGVYDTYLVQPNINDCLERMQFKGFILKLSAFVTALPIDPASKERQFYDQMNMATLAWLIIQKECINTDLKT